MRRYLSILPIALSLICICAAEVRSKPQQKQQKAKPKAAAQIRYDRLAVNNPATTDQIGENSEGSGGLRAQILLDRANFSVGEIDGRMGANALHAVAAFRMARGLPAGTSVDADTWKMLNNDTAPALIETTISAVDVAGPFVKIPPTMMLQAKLKQLG